MKKIKDTVRKWFQKRKVKVITGLIVWISLMNILAILVKPFAAFYREVVFHYVSMFWSYFTGLFPFSLGEVMIALGVFMLLLFLPVMLLGLIRRPFFRKLRSVYGSILVYALVFVYFTETFHCFMLYHAGTLEEEITSVNRRIQKEEEQLSEGDTLRTSHKFHNNISKEAMEASGLSGSPDAGSVENPQLISDQEKLLLVYNEVTYRLNELTGRMKRDANGDLLKDFTYQDCKKALHGIAAYYPLLEGYYPDPKKIRFSNIMSQQYLEGIYFPFSMEANYNRLMYCSNTPAVICHELSHLKGYIREDDANFIAYAACINSDSDFVRYSGYLSVYGYLLSDLLDYGSEEIYERMLRLDERAVSDRIFLKKEVFEKIEENAVISTEALSEATDTFLETNLKMNGVSSGMENYHEVVRLLFLYYNLSNVTIYNQAAKQEPKNYEEIVCKADNKARKCGISE